MTPPVATDHSMREYYARRAPQYERVYAKPERQVDIAAIKAWLPGCFEGCRNALEVACGTGYWTPFAAQRCQRWLATDANDEVLAIARTKQLPHEGVRWLKADAYRLEDAVRADGPFDAVFAGFWWSHVPLAQLVPWLRQLGPLLAPGARIVMLDNRYVPGSITPLSRRDDDGNTYQVRVLDDGSTHEVLKNFPTRDEAFAALGAIAVEPRWTEFAHYWALGGTAGGPLAPS